MLFLFDCSDDDNASAGIDPIDFAIVFDRVSRSDEACDGDGPGRRGRARGSQLLAAR
jgi:hypothetical protein